MEKLRSVVQANSRFSEVSGGILLIGAPFLDATFGLDAWFLAVVGASLVGYGALLWFMARGAKVRPAATLATVMDATWVLAAAVVLLGFTGAMTPAGRGALGAVSVAVAGFAVAQWFWLRRSDGQPAGEVRGPAAGRENLLYP